MRIPGPNGSDIEYPIDRGTSSLSTNFPPGHNREGAMEREWADKQIREGNFIAIEMAGPLAAQKILKTLEELGHDVDQQINIIASLTDGLSKQVGYNFFARFFDHYLPKRFLERYLWGKGKEYKLTLQEFTDCNPEINIRNSEQFEPLYKDAKNAYPQWVPFNKLPIKCGALTSGTLGQFWTRASGQLAASPDGVWQAKGTMGIEFGDEEFDFDPKDFRTGGRTVTAEIETRFAGATLPGKSFKIYSGSHFEFKQDNTDKRVVWAGGNPVTVPNNLSNGVKYIWDNATVDVNIQLMSRAAHFVLD